MAKLDHNKINALKRVKKQLSEEAEEILRKKSLEAALQREQRLREYREKNKNRKYPKPEKWLPYDQWLDSLPPAKKAAILARKHEDKFREVLIKKLQQE